MTNKLNNDINELNNTSNTQPVTSYHLTKEYQDSLKAFMNHTMYAAVRKSITVQDKSKVKSPTIRYRPEDIDRWLQNPVQSEQQLRTLSNYLYDTNALYRWVITTISGMPKYNWKIIQNALTNKKSKSQRKNAYYEAIEYVDKLNLQHELIKVFLIMLKEDWYFGYEIESDEDYFILNLKAEYCKVSSRNADGTYNFKFNFTYFDRMLDILDTYPIEFRNKYNQYLKDNEKWIELDTNKTICLKFNDELDYAIPYFSTLFDNIIDLKYYQDIKKDRAALENSLLIHQYIPVDEKEFNKFAIGADLSQFYHEMANQATEDNVSVITSPMKIEAVRTERSNSDNDYVDQAYRDFYTKAGLPQDLSNSSVNNSVGLAKAITVNEQLVFRFYRQVERVITRKLRYKFKNMKFKFSLLNTTSFNQSDFVDLQLKLAQNGVPNITDMISASGKSPFEFHNDLVLENELFDLYNQLQPLKTSHTQSADDNKGGAPSKSDGDLSDKGVTTRDNGANERRQANT